MSLSLIIFSAMALVIGLLAVFIIVCVFMSEYHRDQMKAEAALECTRNPGSTGAGEITIEEASRENPELVWYYERQNDEAKNPNSR